MAGLYYIDGMTFARTRKALMNALWDMGCIGFNIFKEGPYYAVQHGRVISATYLRRIDDMSVEEWARRLNTDCYPREML